MTVIPAKAGIQRLLPSFPRNVEAAKEALRHYKDRFIKEEGAAEIPAVPANIAQEGATA